MKLTHCCIVTGSIAEMRKFYQDILQSEPQNYGTDYVEFPTEAEALSLYSLAAQERLAPGSAYPATNKSVMLEFQVNDVDKEYARLQRMKIEWVKPPTTQSWGNRSIYFRDPEGNLVNFYSGLLVPLELFENNKSLGFFSRSP